MTSDSANATGALGEAPGSASLEQRASDSGTPHIPAAGTEIASSQDSRYAAGSSLVGVIWDLDGTLADTEQPHFRAWQALCAKYGRSVSWEQFKQTFGLGNPDVLRVLISADLSDEDMQRLSDEKEAMFREMSGKLEPMPGALDLVRHLRALAIPQAIGSSAPRDNIPYVLRALGISELFDATVSRWDVENGKPAPDIFLTAATRIGMPPGKCIVLEDAPAGIAAARAAGMRCIALAGTWPEDMLGNADFRVHTLSEVLWDRQSLADFAAGTWSPLGSA